MTGPGLGLQKGIFCDIGIPGSGRGAAADRERYKQKRDAKKKSPCRQTVARVFRERTCRRGTLRRR
ncbi:hypothetical protein [Fimbriiglobus ruber]|uniref:Uncharacterized protein n=1 Tax=Fimbriiglobus ruber TaxID=1908690 RepID=A0A225DCL7_9BACT|nr:hypothetical protein [Fimbriiglobus ruber]OWK38733.1 hypothetical protein FRUB_07853 [Fimbriiglobus ruber]